MGLGDLGFRKPVTDSAAAPGARRFEGAGLAPPAHPANPRPCRRREKVRAAVPVLDLAAPPGGTASRSGALPRLDPANGLLVFQGPSADPARRLVAACPKAQAGSAIDRVEGPANGAQAVPDRRWRRRGAPARGCKGGRSTSPRPRPPRGRSRAGGGVGILAATLAFTSGDARPAIAAFLLD